MTELSPFDYVIFHLGFWFVVLTLVANIYVIRTHAKYLPMLVRKVPLTFLNSMAGICWFIGVCMQLEQVYRPRGVFFRQCWLWTYIVATLLGFGLWISTLITKYYCVWRLYMNVEMHTRSSRFHEFVVLSVLMVPWLVFSIAACASFAVTWDPELRGCRLSHEGWAIAHWVMISVYFAIFTVMAIMMSASVHDLWEINEIRNGVFVSIALFILCVVVSVMGWIREDWGRFIIAMSVMVSSQFFFFAAMGKPIVASLNNDTRYLEEMVARYRRPLWESADESVSAPFTKPTITPKKAEVSDDD
eukprot:gnl/Spiro4/6036_TR3095_c0_g2_i1.p1 gnl/Spiro4/6036_TR3095_c0_g2~~gnl/Spiro4/6036_TR3095_c0_g2_i1.p1  ORF type:complete len:302 (+),score=35.68 gnl/Spiro4/6036_TR3095_c0_g2_i1:48-953(+)